jgi:hypothetical protein
MKTLFSAALLLGGALVLPQAHAACNYPIAPGKLPDGSVASREEIKAAKDQVVKYDADMNSYLVCIRSEFEAKVSKDATPEQRAELERVRTQKEDAALAEVQDVVARFNEQLKAWKARSAAEKKSS